MVPLDAAIPENVHQLAKTTRKNNHHQQSMKEYNEKTARSTPGAGLNKPPMISISKGGSFRINKKGAELLDLKTGDRVTVLFDEDADEWYIRKSDNGLITFSSRHCSLGFHSAILWNDITKSTGSEKGGYIIASEPTIINKTKAYAILTSSAR